jgi:hypothetical protein
VKVVGITLLVAVFAIVAISPAWSTRSTTQTARCPNGKPPARTVTKIQAIQLDLMRRSSYNNFDGKQVASDLLGHRRLWCAAILDRLGNDALIKLRDIDENYWNADTVYLLSSGADNRNLTRLARTWHADAVYWVNPTDVSQMLGTSESFRILEIWWD